MSATTGRPRPEHSIDLHGSPGLGGIQQTFTTKPGRAYVVTFSFAANPTGPFARPSASRRLGIPEFTADATGKT